MSEYTLEQLLATDREELTRICAEVCYGWEHDADAQTYIIRNTPPDADEWKFAKHFQPLANTEKGKSQAFELAVTFNIFPAFSNGVWMAVISFNNKTLLIEHQDLQTAIVIASILTAQQEKTNE